MFKKNKPENNENNLIDLATIIRTIREEEDIDIVIKKIIIYLHSELDFCLLWVGLYDRLGNRIVGKGGITPNGEISLLKQRFPISDGDLLEQVLRSVKPLEIPDLSAEKQVGGWIKIAQNYQIKGTILFPISDKETSFGVVLMGSQDWGISLESGETALLSLIWGELAQTLDKIQKEWQQKQIKRPDEPIFSLLSELGELTTLDQRLEAVVETTHKFLQPSRTNIYWYYPHGKYFWRRVSNRQVVVEWNDFKRPASGITVQDLGELYQKLAAGKIVEMREYDSSLNNETTELLLQQIRASCVLVAPIILKEELLGFITIEEQDNRQWENDEKNYLHGVGQLVALTSPLSEMEDKIHQAKLDRTLTAGITRAIYGDSDWQKTIKTMADKLSQRLGAKYFMLAIRNQEQFEVIYQNHSIQSHIITNPLPPLSQKDMMLLEKNTEVIGIENWSENHILTPWQSNFEKLGVRSLLLCSTRGGRKQEEEESTIEHQDKKGDRSPELVIIGYDTPRTWNHDERELVQIASQQLGFILHQKDINQQIHQQQQYIEYLQSGLTTLQPNTIVGNPTKVLINSANSSFFQEAQNLTPPGEQSVLENLSLDRLERSFIEFIAPAIMEIGKIESQSVPLIALISWHPVSQTGRIMSYSYADSNITSTDKISIPIRTDTWIQQILSTNDWLHLNVSELPAKTLRWLNILDSGQVIVTALRTAPEHQPTGIFLLADPHGILWQKTEVPQLENSPTATLKKLLTTLVTQLAWSRRYLIVKTTLEFHREELEWLNWYKQRRLEELYRSVGSGFKQLSELNHLPVENSTQQKDILANLRYQQLLRQIGNVLSSTTSLLKEEKWRLQANYNVVSVANLLKRSLTRIDSQVQKRQLQLEVHREGNLSVYGDSIKLELVVYELLISACRRSTTGGKIDIKCQTLDEEWVEISILDQGNISPQLIAEFNVGFMRDILEESPLVTPPGKHLIICRQVIQQMGGDFELHLPKSGLVESRLLLPLAHI